MKGTVAPICSKPYQCDTGILGILFCGAMEHTGTFRAYGWRKKNEEHDENTTGVIFTWSNVAKKPDLINKKKPSITTAINLNNFIVFVLMILQI